MTEDLWNYEFFTYQPDEKGNIDLEAFLMSIIVCMTANKQVQYVKMIKKVKDGMNKEGDVQVSYKEYAAFQQFLANVDLFKSKI